MKHRWLALAYLVPTLLRADDPAFLHGAEYVRESTVCFQSGSGFVCEGEVQDYLRISPPAKGRTDVDVSLHLMFTNGHTCSVDAAKGQWQGERGAQQLHVQVPTFSGSCTLGIHFSAGEAIFRDQEEPSCAFSICGARGWLDGQRLWLKKSLESEIQGLDGGL